MEKQHFELAPVVAQSLSVLPAARSAVDRVYNRDRGRYFAAAMRSPFINDPLLGVGNAMQRVYAVRALGIITDGAQDDIRLLLRYSDRHTYDDIASSSRSLAEGERMVIERVVRPRSGEHSDDYFARFILAMGICAVLGIPVQYTESTNDIIQYALSSRDIAASRKRCGRNDVAARAMKHALGSDSFTGLTDLYDSVTDGLRDRYDHLFRIMNRCGIDGGTYTRDARLEPSDATVIMESGEPFEAAFTLLLARAINADKAFCLDLYNDARPDRAEAARIAQENAQRETDALKLRIAALEADNRRLSADIDAVTRQLAAHDADADELAELRNALWISADRDTPPEHSERQRDIPRSCIIIGGHPTWARRMTESTGVRVWASGTTCPPTVIASASEIWIQPSYMSHSEFYAAVNTARRNEVRIRYFAGAGIAGCVSQLKEQDR